MTKKKRTYNPSLVKQTLSYSTQEIAARFGIHRRTVEHWYNIGLRRIDNRKPFLVLGADLKDFLKAKQKTMKTSCQINELYCLRCRAPQPSWENQIDIKYLTEKLIMLIGL